MRPTFLFAVICTLTSLVTGCQSTGGMTAKSRTKTPAVAENKSFFKKPKSKTNGELPPELAKRLEESRHNQLQSEMALPTIASLLNKAGKLESESDLAGAERLYKEVLDLEATHPQAHHRLAVIADQQGQYGKAEDHYLAALKQKPGDPDLLSDLGYSHFLRGNTQQAERYLLQAMDANPSHRAASVNLAHLYAKEERYEETLQVLRQVADEAEAQQQLARLFPQGPPAAGSGGRELGMPGAGGLQLASGNRSAPPMPPEQELQATQPLSAEELEGMNPNQLRQAMQRRRDAALVERTRQQQREMNPVFDPTTTGSQDASPWPQTGANAALQYASNEPAAGVAPPVWNRPPDSRNGAALAQMAQAPATRAPVANDPQEAHFNGQPEMRPPLEGVRPQSRGDINSAASATVRPEDNMPDWAGAPRVSSQANPQRQMPNINPGLGWPSGGRGATGRGGQEGVDLSQLALQDSPQNSETAAGWNDSGNGFDNVSPAGHQPAMMDGQAEQALWNGGTAQPAPGAGANMGRGAVDPMQMAAEIGMSAGPGTFLPVMGGGAVNSQRGPVLPGMSAPNGFGMNQRTGSNSLSQELPAWSSPSETTAAWNTFSTPETPSAPPSRYAADPAGMPSPWPVSAGSGMAAPERNSPVQTRRPQITPAGGMSPWGQGANLNGDAGNGRSMSADSANAAQPGEPAPWPYAPRP